MKAHLELEFTKQGAATALRCVKQEPPWKVVRGFAQGTGASLVHLNNVSGGIFGGDDFSFRATLGTGAEALITTTGATRLYRPLPDASDAVLAAEFHLERSAVLEYLPDPLIPFSGARALQTTSYVLKEDASLFYWETVAPGRSAADEVFQYSSLRIATEINVCGCPLLLDRMLLEPKRFVPNLKSILGQYTYLTHFVALRVGASSEDINRLVEGLSVLVKGGRDCDCSIGVGRLSEHGVIVRGLFTSNLKIPAMLQSLWSMAKLELCGATALAPRKTY
jgi:urease accessory protein